MWDDAARHRNVRRVLTGVCHIYAPEGLDSLCPARYVISFRLSHKVRHFLVYPLLRGTHFLKLSFRLFEKLFH